MHPIVLAVSSDFKGGLGECWKDQRGRIQADHGWQADDCPACRGEKAF
jgi:hypothetical protein